MTVLASLTFRWPNFFGLLLLLSGCAGEDREVIPSSEIFYKADGRSIKYGEPYPIAIDFNEDGLVDFSVFVELTANASGDHLYVGINPLGANLAIGTEGDDNRFLNMGLLMARPLHGSIKESLTGTERWSSDFLALLIRHTPTSANQPVYYEGDWQAGEPALAGVQLNQSGEIHFGWLRFLFDKESESITLVDYGFNLAANVPIKAGESGLEKVSSD